VCVLKKLCLISVQVLDSFFPSPISVSSVSHSALQLQNSVAGDKHTCT